MSLEISPPSVLSMEIKTCTDSSLLSRAIEEHQRYFAIYYYQAKSRSRLLLLSRIRYSYIFSRFKICMISLSLGYQRIVISRKRDWEYEMIPLLWCLILILVSEEYGNFFLERFLRKIYCAELNSSSEIITLVLRNIDHKREISLKVFRSSIIKLDSR